jgi:hypothetical protein
VLGCERGVRRVESGDSSQFSLIQAVSQRRETQQPQAEGSEMSKQFRFRINVECDVQNADSESIARTAAFALLTQMQSEKKRGRPSSDVKATITGVSIEDQEKTKPALQEICSRIAKTIDVTERDQ